MQVTKDFIPGYREVLVGEKLKQYEDESRTQGFLQKAQGQMKNSIRSTSSHLVTHEDPKEICYRNKSRVDE